MKLTSKKIMQAVRKTECVEIDYGDMTEDEIRVLEYNMDVVFAAAKECAKIMEKYTELKVLEAKDL